MRRRSFHIDDTLWHQLLERARTDGTTASALIRDLIRAHLNTPKENR